MQEFAPLSEYFPMEFAFARRVFDIYKYPFCIVAKPFGEHNGLKLQRHDFVQAWYCVEGEYIHFVGDKVYYCKEGSFVVVPPGVGHNFIIRKEDHVVLACIEATAFFFRSAPEELRPDAMAALFLHSFAKDLKYQPSFFVELSEDERKVFESTLLRLAKYDYSKTLPNILHIRKKLCELFHLPSFALSEKQRTQTEKIIKTKLFPIMDAVLYMNKNFGSRIDSEELCSVSAMCYSDFFKYFKIVCGTTFTLYLRQLRVQMAKYFIVFSRYSLDYIADICGLCDRTYMSKLFTKYFGYTIREERTRQEKNRHDYPFFLADHDTVERLNLEFDL
ncbi:MAG: AraC family transcriptional regulator [Ruminococcaceae bacterium]|nr:AraC family transcriptional regulator [Oscillospiraceae bacterium]